MKKFFQKHKKVLISGLCLLLVTVAVGIFTLSKFMSDEETDATVTLEDFSAVARVYLKNGNEVTIEKDDNGNQYVEVDRDDLDGASLTIEYTGNAKTYCRFKLSYSWYREIDIDNDGEKEKQLVPYVYPTYEYDDEVIYDNTKKDSWFYIMNMMEEPQTVEGITKITLGEALSDPVEPGDAATKIRLLVTVDCVQFNRVSALWKMNTLPWWNTDD
ncbi:MAG: hypothetical protein IJ192_02615 [Clostridia bacterium]|nr:hypothetical protein [Clostridia bacterium]